MILCNKRITKTLIRLRGCAGWFAPLLFVRNITKDRFSRVEAHLKTIKTKKNNNKKTNRPNLKNCLVQIVLLFGEHKRILISLSFCGSSFALTSIEPEVGFFSFFSFYLFFLCPGAPECSPAEILRLKRHISRGHGLYHPTNWGAGRSNERPLGTRQIYLDLLKNGGAVTFTL